MRKLLIGTVLVVVLLAGLGPVFGQGDGELACSADDVTAVIADARATLDEADGALDDDVPGALVLLQDAARQLMAAGGMCSGRQWSGEGTGSDVALIDLRAGAYIIEYEYVVATSYGGGIAMSFEAIEDGFIPSMTDYRDVGEGETATGREAFRVRESGEYLVNIDTQFVGEWSIAIISP